MTGHGNSFIAECKMKKKTKKKRIMFPQTLFIIVASSTSRFLHVNNVTDASFLSSVYARSLQQRPLRGGRGSRAAAAHACQTAEQSQNSCKIS